MPRRLGQPLPPATRTGNARGLTRYNTQVNDPEGDRTSVYHHDIGGCFVCGKPVEDPRFRCRVSVVREWRPEATSLYVAHVECLRRVKHHTVSL